MSLTKNILLSFIMVFFFCTLVKAQSLYDTYSGFTVPINPVLPAAETHPSLWFNKAGIEEIKNKKNTDAYALKVWNYIQTDFKKFSGKTASSLDFNDRPKMAKSCAFAWIISGDTLGKRKAIEALLLAYDNVPRTATAANFDGDYDEIYRATWFQNYCEAYDWVYNELTLAQNATIRNKIIEEIKLLRNNMVSGVKYAPRPHNHRSKPAYGIITGALTLTSDPLAADWLQFGLTQANTVTKYQFSSDGIYREGSHYFIYTVVNFLPYLWQYKNVSGQDHFPYYKACFEMPVILRNSKGWLPNIEDSYVKPVPTHMVAKAYLNTPTSLNKNEPLSKILQWNWFNTNFFTVDYTGATNDVLWNIDEYITYDPTIIQAAPDMETNIKTNCGVVVFRDNANYQTPPTKQLLFHAVAECDNHQHPDLLSYVLDYKGTILATDAGYGKDGYSDSKRSWYTAPYAHNMVTVNSAAPLDYAVNIPPKDLQFINAPLFVFSEKEALTSAANGKLKRGIAFPNKNYWVVYDVCTADKEANYSLSIHSRGTLTRNNNQLTWTTSDDTYGKTAKLFSFVLSSEPNTISEAKGYTSLFKDEIAQTYVNVTQIKDTALFMHLLYPADPASSYPTITDLSSNGVSAFRVDGTEYDLFTLQKNVKPSTVDAVTTDAIFSWTNYNPSFLKKFFMNRGRLFSYKGSEIINTDKAVTLHADFTSGSKFFIYVDTLSAKTEFKIKKTMFPFFIAGVKYNNSDIQFGESNGNVIFTIEGNGIIEMSMGYIDGVKEAPVPGNHGSLELNGNYPNPFNPVTRINFTSNSNTPVNLSVFDILGRCKRNLIKNELIRGNFEISWDGKDNDGRSVNSGIYFFSLSDGTKTIIKKGMLVK